MTINGLLFLWALGNGCAGSPGQWATRLERVPAESGANRAVLALPDDWQTGGDWRERYGRFLWVLCGGSSLWDYKGGRKIEICRYSRFIGEHRDPKDGLRAWIHWPYLPAEVPENVQSLSAKEQEKLRGPLGRIAPKDMALWGWADVRRVLLNPVNGGRRQSSWDDHAEGYNPWFNREGPHLYVNVSVPSVPCVVSLYFVNKDAHSGHANRFRDYLIEVKEQKPSYGKSPGWEKEFEKAKVLAQCPVNDFYDGVYKRFLVAGPRKLTLRIHKDDSINTILSGLFVDPFLLSEKKVRSAFQRALWRAGAKEEWTLIEKVRECKRKAPSALCGLLPELGADAGLMAGEILRDKEVKLSGLDRVEALCVLLGELLQYERRDELWARYVNRFEQWLNQSPQPELLTRKEQFRSHWERAKYLPGISREQVAGLAGRYFQSQVRLEPRLGRARKIAPRGRSVRTVVEELRDTGWRRAVSQPRVALEALLALDRLIRGKGKKERFAGFNAKELYALAESYRQMGEHGKSAHTFGQWMRRFRGDALEVGVKVRLEQEKAMAVNQEKARNQKFTVGTPPGRPGN